MLKELDDSTKIKGDAWEDEKADWMMEDLSDETPIGGVKWSAIREKAVSIDKLKDAEVPKDKLEK